MPFKDAYFKGNLFMLDDIINFRCNVSIRREQEIIRAFNIVYF